MIRDIGIFLAVVLILAAARIAIQLCRRWVQGHIKNPAAKQALDYIGSLAETLVAASADRVRGIKAAGNWHAEAANDVKQGVITDLKQLGGAQLQTIQDASAVDIENLLGKIVEAKVEKARPCHRT